jgi:hypothetical protein
MARDKWYVEASTPLAPLVAAASDGRVRFNVELLLNGESSMWSPTAGMGVSRDTSGFLVLPGAGR